MPYGKQRPGGAVGGKSSMASAWLSNRWFVPLSLMLTVALSCILAWSGRWLQDDAYITFRYASHVLDGHGPVWNAGEAVEGYSNFSWMVALIFVRKLGIGFELGSQLLGVLCLVWSLLSIFQLGRSLLPSDRWALLATFLAATNYSFFMYATGGLETQLIAALSLQAWAITAHALRKSTITALSATFLSLILALAVMTRPDAPLIALMLGGTAIAVAARARAPLQVWIALLVPGTLLLTPWLFWKYAFYEDLLPNTYYAKAGTRTHLTFVRGFIYAAWPFLSYFWLAAILAIAVALKRKGSLVFPRDPATLLCLGYVLVWNAYVVWTGGDVMELRFLIPIIPVVLILLTSASARAWSTPLRAWPMVTILAVGTIFHAQFFPTIVRPNGIGNIPSLFSNVRHDSEGNWTAIGKQLFDDLGPESKVRIALTPAGAIPYFSGLWSLDMLGLNDKWVAREGQVRTKCVVCQSHARLATVEYLLQNRVHLLIGHPQVRPMTDSMSDAQGTIRRMFFNEDVDYENLPRDARLVLIPLGPSLALHAVYLTPSQEIESQIQSGRWKTLPLPVSSAARR